MAQSSEKSEYHAWKPYFFWLLLKVYFLRVMAYVEVALTDKLRPHPGNDVRIERVKFPSRDKGRSIVAYVYTPVDLPEGYKPPVHLNIHGSGFVVHAFFGNSRWFCYQVAKQLKCVVIDTDYRKAPEHPFPQPTRDCQDAAFWIFSQPDRYDLSRFTVSGFSAGGNLAMGVAATLGPERVKAVVSFYSPLNATTPGASEGRRPPLTKEFRSGVILVPWVFASFFHSYVTPQTDYAEPMLSPQLQPIEKMPKRIMLVCGDADVMYLDSVDFFEHIQKHGSAEQKANLIFFVAKNEAHAFDEQPKFPESVEKRDRAYQTAIDMIRASWY